MSSTGNWLCCRYDGCNCRIFEIKNKIGGVEYEEEKNIMCLPLIILLVILREDPLRVIIVVVSLIAIIFPLYWLLTSSVKIEAEYLSNPPGIFPSKFTAASYQEIFGKDQLWLNFFNTVVVAGASTIISVIFGSMAAYAVARGSLGKRARKYFGLWFMVQKTYPAIATAIPVYLVMRQQCI